MDKGQISLDFLLAIIFALVILVGLNAVSEQATAMQKAVSVRQQLHATGMNVVSVLSTSEVLNGSPAGTTVVGITPQLLAVPDETGLQQCGIVIDSVNSKLLLSYSTVEEGISFSVPAGIAFNPLLTSADPGKCGSAIFAVVAP